MKNLKKLTFGLVVLLGFGLAITLNSFTTKKVTALKYRYEGATATGITNPANWTDVSNQSNPSGCGGDEIPCLVQFNDSEYADMSAFLAAKNSLALIEASGRVTSHKDEQ